MNWKDIINDSDEWTGLRIEVNENITSTFQLESGANCRFKLNSKKYPILWGTFGEEYWGVWILNNKIDWELNDMPVLPITSPIIETSKNTDYYKFWSRFFIKQLGEEKTSILSTGTWTLTIGASIKNKNKKAAEFINEIDNAFEIGNPRWIDWDTGRWGSLVAIKEEPTEESGRVKWFRKLVRQDVCPPVLVWYLTCLDGYIILDGHARLKAFQLETVPAKFLILNSIKEQKITRDTTVQKQVLLGIEKRQRHPVKAKMKVEDINSLLIRAFDTRPYCYPMTKAKARRDFDEKWTSEVKALGFEKNLDADDIEDMINRIEH